ncbi:MAG: hypothetical protein NW224_07360 [Leptolyngbyaceae cyanobacterium bins.302]|nr:hypothetical protein [Leptolyngbyaceae cyanobacterium bins.302]
MSQFQLFDSVKLTEAIPLSEGGSAPEGTPGAIMEIFKNGEAYLVELFGGWVKAEVGEDFVPSDRDAPDSFMETIGIETVYPHQFRLVKPAHETVGIRAQLLALIDELPENTLEQVKNFAEFLQKKQH